MIFVAGFHFYEEQETGLGAYFLESLYSDIESLKLYVGIHRQPYRDFPSHAFETVSICDLLQDGCEYCIRACRR
jgi:hypothetical protein